MAAIAPKLYQALRKSGLLPTSPRVLWQLVRSALVDGGRPSSLCALAAARDPDHLAVSDDLGVLRFQELNARMQSPAVMCRNHRVFIGSLLAASALGADAVLLNTEFPGPQLTQALGHHQLGCVLHDAEFSTAFRQSGWSGGALVAESMEQLRSEERRVGKE